MRQPAVNGQAIGRAGAVVLLAGAILTAAISIHSADRSHVRAQGAPGATHSINAGLERCRDLGTAAENDAECLAVWSQLRRHFFDTKLQVGAGGRS